MTAGPFYRAGFERINGIGAGLKGLSLMPCLQAVLALWDQGKVKPLIDRTYPFAEAAAAHRRILQHQNTGKIVLEP